MSGLGFARVDLERLVCFNDGELDLDGGPLDLSGALLSIPIWVFWVYEL